MKVLRVPVALLCGPAALLTGTALLTWGTRAPLAAVTAPGSAPFEDLLALAAAAGAWCVLGWLTAGLLLAVLARLLGAASPLARWAQVLTPSALHRLAAALLGLGLVAGPMVTALPAQALTVSAAAQPGSPSAPDTAAVLNHWTPDRPAAPSRVHPRREPTRPLLVSDPHPERAVTDDVVVRRGDTLWDIAARALGPGASAADIATSWPRWYVANRSTIGPDPDLIRPGQLLRPPGS